MVINFGEENEKASIVHIDLSQGKAQKMINKKNIRGNVLPLQQLGMKDMDEDTGHLENDGTR